jgi:prepilin-type N-terminal cleavage/methylation domain-containing protein
LRGTGDRVGDGNGDGNGIGNGIGNGVGIGQRSQPSEPGRASHRGTTLLELLVVLALLSLVVLVAAELVTHSIRLLGATGRAVRNPLTVQVNERLRRDVQEAGGVLTVEDMWSSGPFELQARSGDMIQYRVVAGELLRRTVNPGGVEERVLLRGVTSWWWRSPAPGVVDLNYGILVGPPPERHSAVEVGSGRERRIENLRFAVRGAGGGRRW